MKELIYLIIILVLIGVVEAPPYFSSEGGIEDIEPTKQTIKTEYTYNTEKDSYYNELDEIKSEIYRNGSVRLSKWNEEVFIDLNLPNTFLTASNIASSDNQTFQLTSNSIDLKYYLKNVSENTRGFEYEIILKQKPLTNSITIPIETENLVFYYQPALNASGRKDCNATDCDGDYRPIDVIGSYAVYHSSKSGNEYKTGKAFHIYRPKIIDANNNEIWADLEIKDSTMTITISQEFLNNSVYPIVIDPGFGETDIGGSVGTICSSGLGGPGTNFRKGSGFASGGSGTLDSITGYFLISEGGIDTSLTMNGENSSGPNSHGEIETIEKALGVDDDGWQVFDAIGTTEFEEGNYVLNAACDTSQMTGFFQNNQIHFDLTGGRGYDESVSAYPLDDPWNKAVDSTRLNSIYVNYTVAPPPPPVCNCTFPNDYVNPKEINMSCYCNTTINSHAKNVSLIDIGEWIVNATLNITQDIFGADNQIIYGGDTGRINVGNYP